MDELFLNNQNSESRNEEKKINTRRAPLAARMRPQNLDQILGQAHLISDGMILRRSIDTDQFTSILLYGPPGTGKTTIAAVIAKTSNCRFEKLNGVESNVAEIRQKITQAETYKKINNQETILFIDEIHRFSKSQQDVLLPHIEDGTIRFIGATTHNPYYYVNSPLVSRSQVFQLEPINPTGLVALMERAILDPDNGYGTLKIQADSKALTHIAEKSDGDARKALNALELAISTIIPNDSKQEIHLDLTLAEQSIQQKSIHYDATGDSHYDTISAFIKSIRGSDPDAALYWLAKMLTAGEDPRYIARRLIISASEDIGLADSNAIRVALSAHQAFEVIGMPEGRIPLAHATVYLATAPKSNSAYAGINNAMQDVENGVTLPVPPHLRTKSRKKIAASNGSSTEELTYHYAHDYTGNFVPQKYFNGGKQYYKPTSNGMEKRISDRLDFWKEQITENNNTNKSKN